MASSSTPLRYPGGKQKIFSFIKEIIELNGLAGIEYAEPYAGGAGVAIELLLNNIVKKIYLNDTSIAIYSFWKTLVDAPEWLCKKILLASLTVDEWKKQREIFKNHNNYSTEEIGFSTLYLNRCNRSGILTGGLIGGLKQNGVWKMDARFSRKDLIQRIEAIANRKSDIYVSNDDAEIFIKYKIDPSKHKKFIYFDPPYLNKAEHLYLNHYDYNDHKRIAQKIQNIKEAYWIVSYDFNEYITDLYKDRKYFVYNIQYNALKAYIGKELFIFSDNLAIPRYSKIKCINEAIN